MKAKKCRTAGKQRDHHSVELDRDLNKLIRHSRRLVVVALMLHQ